MLSLNNGERAIIKENIRRFWPISLVFFLLLFCTSVLPAMLIDYLEAPMFISARNPMLFFVFLILPVVAANAVFRYLYTSSGSTYMHAFPLSRRTLFKGSFLSGLILSVAPVLLTMFTVLPIVCMNTFFPLGKKLSVVSFSEGALQLTGTYNSTLELSGWFALALLGLLILFFLYALAAFAAILTGMGSGQIAISYVLNFILVFLCLIVVGYLDAFLIGFSSNLGAEVFLAVNPLIYYTYHMNDAGHFALGLIAVYFAIACFLVFAARKLYERRKLERAGSPICFSSAETAVIWLVTLVSMAGLGMAFSIAVGDYRVYSKVGLVAGCVIGACVAFMVMAMLTQKTPKVFTMKNLKAFGVFAIVGVLFIAFTAFDLTGFTNRVPDPERVQTVKLSFSTYPFPNPYREGYYGIDPFDVEVSSAQDINAAVAFHKGLIGAEKANMRGVRDDYVMGPYNWGGRVTFAYKLGGAAKMGRSFHLQNNYANSELVEGLAGMTAFRESVTLDKLVGYDNIIAVQFSNYDFRYDGEIYSDDIFDKDADKTPIQLSDAKIRELVQCLDRDFLSLSVQEIAGTALPMPEELIVFTFEYRKPDEINTRGYYTRIFTYVVTSSYSETLDFMKRR